MKPVRRSLESKPSTALWLAAGMAVPLDVHRRLLAGGAALELGCGGGLGCLALAEAYPGARITGHDEDPEVVARARALARAAELEERVTFAVAGTERLPRAALDLVLLPHLSAKPAASDLLNAVRNALVPDGVCLLLEPLPPLYARKASPAPLVEHLRGLANRAGFSRFSFLGRSGVEIFELRR